MQVTAQVLAVEVITMASSVLASVQLINFSHLQIASQQLIQTSKCLRHLLNFLTSANFSVRTFLTKTFSIDGNLQHLKHFKLSRHLNIYLSI